MVTVHLLGIVRNRCIFNEIVTLTKTTTVQNLETVSLCVRLQS